MAKHLIMTLLLLPLVLVGCKSDSTGPETYVPELDSFDIIDSLDTDTSRPNYPPLVLDPYLYDGLFEVFWSAYSREPYRVNLRINDRPSIANSLLVYSEACDPKRGCKHVGNFICSYDAELYLACETGDRLDIQPLFKEIPQRLHLFLEVCDGDSSFCEYNYYPVTFQ